MFIANQLSEYISFNDDYSELNNEQIKERSSLKGALLERETVCIGYAMAFERCMNALGVESKIVKGEGNCKGKTKREPLESDHAWNVVKIKNNWYNLDISLLSTYKDIAKQKSGIDFQSIIENYILSSDDEFLYHYKLEDNGIRCEETLKDRFEIYKKVKKYKNVLEAYDNGKRSNMLQIELENNNTEKENRDIEKEEDTKQR